MPDLVISEFMDHSIAETLAREFDTHWNPDLWSDRKDLLSLVAGARGIIVRNATVVDLELLDAAPRLLLVARMGVGLDNIDVRLCQSRGVEVCPSVGANAGAVAEYVIATALTLLRWPAYSATPEVLCGRWDRPRFAGVREIAGRTIGIVGFGSIGQLVASRALGMGMNAIAADVALSGDHPAWGNVRRVDLESLLAEADVITLHCPRTPETINLIAAAQFQRMKPGAILINSARGGIVDEAACAAALRSGRLGGAALDTLDVEPIDGATAALFSGIPNLILTPHIAGVTREANRRIAEVAAANVRRVLGGSAMST